jgi:hypothetical protein
VGSRLEHDPGVYHRLARLRLGQARERNSVLDLEIIVGTLSIFKRAMFAPDCSRFMGQAAVSQQIFLGTGRTYPSTYRM